MVRLSKNDGKSTLKFQKLPADAVDMSQLVPVKEEHETTFNLAQ